jgi:hypothetical protein
MALEVSMNPADNRHDFVVLLSSGLEMCHERLADLSGVVGM